MQWYEHRNEMPERSTVRSPTASTWPRRAAAVATVFGICAAAVAARLAGASQSPARHVSTAMAAASPESTAVLPAPDPRAALGRELFFDASLSDPPGTSCASCHDAAHGFAGNNGSRSGVARGSREGHFARRNTPSVLYLRFVPRFHFHWEEDVDLPDATGGFFWDGRSDSLASLVQQPLFNPNEMNAGDARQVRDKIASAPYAARFRETFAGAIDDPDATVAAMGGAIEAFLESDEMSPFSSKYDDYLRGRTLLSPLEAQGLRLFKDRAKGACDACHKLNDASPKPERSLFTDYGFEAVGVPRNRDLAANHDPTAFDLGICERHDHPHMEDDRLCGAFRTPSLRNVAVRQSFMHNGAFSKLRDVVEFYATRGTDPARWYRSKTSFDDLPQKYRTNVNTTRVPYDRGTGEKRRLDESEVDAIVAFMQTLTDAQYR
jgi:cytochrome c peroxidase